MLDYTIDNRGDVGAWWVELILSRVVALRNVRWSCLWLRSHWLPAKIVFCSHRLWIPDNYLSRHLLHFTGLYSNCLGTDSKACTHRDLISTLLGGFKLHVQLVFSFICLWPQGTWSQYVCTRNYNTICCGEWFFPTDIRDVSESFVSVKCLYPVCL